MEITKIPHKVLRNKTRIIPVEDIKNGLYKELVLDMKRSMIEHQGVGLAANQVGKDLSIFVIDENLALTNEASSVYFNPEITESSKDSEDMEEGCLSIPEYFRPIKRSKKIKIKFIDEHGNKIKTKARGFLARVLQHETDHLYGTVIKDRFEKK